MDPISFSDEIDPATGQPVNLSISQEIMMYAFMVIMVGKTLAFDVGIFNYIKRYYQTYKTFNQVEIWILLLTGLKVTILLPDYFLKEINFLYWVFVLNSLTTFWLSHVLHLRGCIIQ